MRWHMSRRKRCQSASVCAREGLRDAPDGEAQRLINVGLLLATRVVLRVVLPNRSCNEKAIQKARLLTSCNIIIQYA